MELKMMIDCLSDIGVDDEYKEMAKKFLESGQKSGVDRISEKMSVYPDG